MKRTAPVLAVLLLMVLALLAATACGGSADAGTVGDDSTASSTDGVSSTDTTAGPKDDAASTDTTAASKDDEGAASSDKVFEPNELLSAEEASAITTFAVTLEEGSLYKDEESGTVSERYKYDIDGSTIHALVEIHQDGLRSGDGSAKDDFLGTQELVKSESTTVQLGEDAFTAGQGQLHLLYGSYYIVVAFDADEYGDDELNAQLNTKLGAKILENLKAKLG